jgi:hypothetical protein
MMLRRLASCLALAFSLASASPSNAQQRAFPDFDLSITCREDLVLESGQKETLTAFVILTTTANESGVGPKGWALSIASQGAARVTQVSLAGTAGAKTPEGLQDGGFEKFEITTGVDNEGAVGAVVLSFVKDITLPPTGESKLLRLDIEISTPTAGCLESGLIFRDGLRGGGQPVETTLTWDGKSRRDDGSVSDNDSDLEANCLFQVCLPGVTTFLRGDCDGSRGLNLTDAIFELNYLFRAGTVPGCLDACDVTDDGGVNITDPIYLLNHLFLSGPQPPPPASGCGTDSTDDPLTCVQGCVV